MNFLIGRLQNEVEQLEKKSKVTFPQMVEWGTIALIYDELKKYNVFGRKYFYPLCSQYNCYRQLPSSAPENLPNATKVVQEVLSLPLYGELTPANVERICSLIQSVPHAKN